MNNTILDFSEENGLVFCSDVNGAKNKSEILYLNEAQKLGIDTVFFRRYYNDGELEPFKSEPAVCIFEKGDSFLDSQEHIKLHAALWSAGKNEVYIIKCPSRIDIINARSPAQVKSENELSINDLILASSTAVNGINKRLFSAYLFANGTFWEQSEFENKLDEKNSPYIFLLDYLMTVRNMFLSRDVLDLPPETIDKLLVTCILIKFLEEIKDDNGKHTLRSIYQKYKVSTFSEALDQNLTTSILNDLASEFNGRIFDKFSTEEKKIIQNTDLKLIGHFLRAKLDIKSGQLFIWEQYSFKHLPAEIISAIYENFIQAESIRLTGGTEKGVVYTPIHLVNMLVDEVMPLNKPELFKNNSFKVLDPTCGSGVFLVAAYKRLLQWWAINNSNADNIQYPDSKRAQKILEENIFGIDVKKTATLVTIFGLTTALLDKLTPQQIWNNLKFNDLSQNNIRTNNFFDWALNSIQNDIQFDLIIGNPPFNLESGKSKIDVLSPDLLSGLQLNNIKIPNNNFALHFFEGSLLLGKRVCMIIPSNVLLYNKNAQSYRKGLFTRCSVQKIFDFTHLREVLFTKKNNKSYENNKKMGRTPVVSIIVETKPSEGNQIEHIVVKRSTSVEKKLRFEIDYYDRFLVNHNWVIDENRSFIWKTNLLGGGRLFHLIYRLSQLPTFKDYINELKLDNSEWIYSSGYKIGGSNGKKQTAHYIHLKSTIDTSIKFNEELGTFSTVIETAEAFEAPRGEKLYSPPVLVISETLGNKRIPMQLFEKSTQPFNISFVGVHAPPAEVSKLRFIYNRLSKNEDLFKLNKMFMLVTSSKLLIHKETAFIKEDLDNLPFPENDELLTISPEEKIIQDDVLNYYIHLGKSISAKSAGKIFNAIVDNEQLKRYGEIFCESLNSIYARNGKLWQIGKINISGNYIYYQLGFGDANKLVSKISDSLDLEIQAITEDKLSNSGTIYKRVIRIYKHVNGFDCIFFIKPRSQRYWFNSIALRDADTTFVDLKKAGF